MSTVKRRYTFIVHRGIDADIEDMVNEDPAEAAVLITVVDEVKGDMALCERLIDVGYEDEQVRHVKEFKALQASGFNTYTVRLCEVDGWRLITAVDHRERVIALLYIMRRDENYDAVVQTTVVEAYQELGLKQLGH